MIQKKSNLKKIFDLYLVVLAIQFFCFIIFTLNKPNTTGEINLSIKNSGCDRAEIFFNSSKNMSLDESKNIKISLKKNNDFNQYKSIIDFPTSYFRLDPCDQKTINYINNFSIIINGKEREVSLKEMSSWNCINCIAKIDENNQYLSIISQNNDPILFTDSFENYTPNKEKMFNYEQFKKYILTSILIMLSVPLIYFLLNLKIKKLALFLLLFFETIVFAFISKFNDIKFMFNYQKINKEKVISYSSYFGYPTTIEFLIIFLTFLLPMLILLINSLLKKNKK